MQRTNRKDKRYYCIHMYSYLTTWLKADISQMRLVLAMCVTQAHNGPLDCYPAMQS